MAAGPVTRKIELAQQVEEARLVVHEQGNVTRRDTAKSIEAERLRRRQALLETLIWNQDHEHLIRAWAAERRGDGLRFRMVGGRFCWAPAAAESWTAVSDDEANFVLARLDAPAREKTLA